MPDLHILGQELENIIVIFKINTLEFVNMQSFIQKQKNFKLRTKNTFKNLGIFELQFNENCDEIFNQHPRIVKTINFPLK